MNEKLIEKYMKNLGLSREEAIQLIADDENDVSVDLTPEQKKNVKEVTRGDRKKETTPRKRERKPDAAKRQLIDLLVATINDNVSEANIINPEREIEFDFLGECYRLILSKPRK